MACSITEVQGQGKLVSVLQNVRSKRGNRVARREGFAALVGVQEHQARAKAPVTQGASQVPRGENHLKCLF